MFPVMIIQGRREQGGQGGYGGPPKICQIENRSRNRKRQFGFIAYVFSVQPRREEIMNMLQNGILPILPAVKTYVA